LKGCLLANWAGADFVIDHPQVLDLGAPLSKISELMRKAVAGRYGRESFRGISGIMRAMRSDVSDSKERTGSRKRRREDCTRAIDRSPCSSVCGR